MITEDYTSVETAKLLKEKGFDWGCDMYYTEIGSVTYTQLRFNHNEIKNRYSRPTLQMAMKWLREMHNIHIEVGLQEHISEDKFQYHVKLFNPEMSTWVLNACVYNWDTYEAACEAAIKYCLKILVINLKK